MRYECTSETLYNNYRTGETLEYRDSSLKLLTARANNGNGEAKKYMAMIEPDNNKWKPKPCRLHLAVNTDARTQLNEKTKDTVMSMQTNEATGPSDQTGQAAQPSEVMDMLGVSFVRKYLIVMVIFAWLVSAQVDPCQPPMSTT